MASTNGSASETNQASLKDQLTAALPTGFNCKIRYVHSPPKPCDPLFSALPGQDPEKTRLASHFLTVSVDPASLSHLGEAASKEAGGDVISFAVEVLAYTSKHLTTLFVSKVDSTSFIPRVRPSPIKTAVTTFLRWLANEERRKRPRRKVVISLFARAQAQYLFPGSSDDKTKHVLDDRQLIKWWARVLDPIFPDVESAGAESEPDVHYQGYMTVPGYVGSELRSFMPPSTSSQQTPSRPHWVPGNPLLELARARGVPEHAPPRCHLPRFPDDPKARFMQDLDDEIGISQDSKVTVSPSKRKNGRWTSVRDLDRFWEQMEFRQECSSGRVVGFLWLVISPKDVEASTSQPLDIAAADSQESATSLGAAASSDPIDDPTPTGSANSCPKKRKRKALTGLIVPRQPRLKQFSTSNLSEMQAEVDAQAGEGITFGKEGYDRAMHSLLQQDFSSLKIAARSTSKWISEVKGIAGLNEDFGIAVAGAGRAETTAANGNATNGAAAVNDLGGMIRKKRKAADGPAPGGQAVSGTQDGAVGGAQPGVNVLGGGMVRKKPKAG